MRAFLSSACERFLSLFVWVHELLTYDATLYPHARTASTREVTAALTYGLEGPPSLSAMLRHSRLKIAAPPTAITAARIGCRPGSSPYAHVGSCPSCTPCFPSHPLSAPALRETSRREPFIKDTIEPGTLVYTDEYSIYARLERWGYAHKRVNHGRGEYARDEDGDGFCEVHVNTMEGFWSLLRSWLRPHRGISQEKLPLYLGFFECVHNVRRRGKALLGSLIELLVTKDPGSQ